MRPTLVTANIVLISRGADDFAILLAILPVACLFVEADAAADAVVVFHSGQTLSGKQCFIISFNPCQR